MAQAAMNFFTAPKSGYDEFYYLPISTDSVIHTQLLVQTTSQQRYEALRKSMEKSPLFSPLINQSDNVMAAINNETERKVYATLIPDLVEIADLRQQNNKIDIVTQPCFAEGISKTLCRKIDRIYDNFLTLLPDVRRYNLYGFPVRPSSPDDDYILYNYRKGILSINKETHIAIKKYEKASGVKVKDKYLNEILKNYFTEQLNDLAGKNKLDFADDFDLNLQDNAD